MVALFMLAACSSIDCPLSNRVYATFRLAGEVDTLYDTLTIATMRSIDNPEEDTVLINKLTLCDSLNLPMSYTRGKDTFYFMLQQYGTGLKTIDTVGVEKENLPHFESVDCNPSMFHTINGVGLCAELPRIVRSRLGPIVLRLSSRLIQPLRETEPLCPSLPPPLRQASFWLGLLLSYSLSGLWLSFFVPRPARQTSIGARRH